MRSASRHLQISDQWFPELERESASSHRQTGHRPEKKTIYQSKKQEEEEKLFNRELTKRIYMYRMGTLDCDAGTKRSLSEAVPRVSICSSCLAGRSGSSPLPGDKLGFSVESPPEMAPALNFPVRTSCSSRGQACFAIRRARKPSSPAMHIGTMSEIAFKPVARFTGRFMASSTNSQALAST